MQKWFKLSLGAAVAFGVGFTASRLGIAVPAPPALMGALVVVAMTLGYVIADRFLGRRPSGCRELCGGPDGGVRNDSNGGSSPG